jgi:hypothetical protein
LDGELTGNQVVISPKMGVSLTFRLVRALWVALLGSITNDFPRIWRRFMITIVVRCRPLYACDTASTSVSTTNGYLHARPNDSSALYLAV